MPSFAHEAMAMASPRLRFVRRTGVAVICRQSGTPEGVSCCYVGVRRTEVQVLVNAVRRSERAIMWSAAVYDADETYMTWG